MRRRRVWCETLDLDALSSPGVISLLARYDLELLAAVRPDDLESLPRVLTAAARRDVRVALWPMLDDRDGRWLSTHNAARFGDFVRAVLRRARGHRVTEIAFDLEPPIGVFSLALSELRSTHTSREVHARASAHVAATLREVHGHGVAAAAVVVPMVLFDARRRGWQRALGTPVDDLAWDRFNAMTYTSIFEGWSRGALRRRDATALLHSFCLQSVHRHGSAASVSLGAVDTGALGDEPIYRSPSELLEDVSVATSAGVDDITLFDLAGALRRRPAEQWLEALTASPIRVAPPESWRASAIVRACRAVGGPPAQPARQSDSRRWTKA